jgi:cytidine deaminase
MLARQVAGSIVPAEEAASLADELGVTVAELQSLLVPLAAERYAQPPISGFRVGAVALGPSGTLYLGANLELPGTALAFTVHAEQSATANAWLNGEEGLTAIAVSAAPCGHCRQFLNELATASSLEVLVAGHEPRLLSELLPESFGPADLGVRTGLMSPRANGLTLDPEPSDPLVPAALAAANASYAPYSRAFAGVALETASGAVYTGRYAENAAFNPSLTPLACALALRALGGGDDEVTRAVLVEAPSQVSQAGAAAETLRAISAAALESYEAVV